MIHFFSTILKNDEPKANNLAKRNIYVVIMNSQYFAVSKLKDQADVPTEKKRVHSTHLIRFAV